ncbi:adenosine deaminase 2-like [Lutzomyia longipalpis]|uniref:adenosine deaminase 2-like n=1 Tax=Lutzomyia longipalpis TaxID=7200 RepID=UPI002483DF72|nr:adenosine deaminase 2-like [Lutzomyia longipalpis]
MLKGAFFIFFSATFCAFLVEPKSLPDGKNSSILQHEFTRNAVKDFEDRIRMGSFFLEEDEIRADEIVRAFKMEEIVAGMHNSSNFLPSHHFFRVKEKIEKSKVFKLIQKMPKGAILHAHLSAMVSSEWLLKNVTYREGAIIYTNSKNIKKFTFQRPDPPQEWAYLSNLRDSADNVTAFDEWLESKFNLYTPNPETDYPDIDVVWTRFENMFTATSELIRYVPVFKDYVYQMLEELDADNVMYAEFRTSFGDLYDESGKIYSAIEHAQILIEVIEDFKKDHPNFFGAKAIFTGNRNRLAEGSERDIKVFMILKERFPNFIVGFDIAAQEKIHNTNLESISALKGMQKGTKFFFHAGETNWYGTGVDENLIDAILLNTTRIGHGYALIKHPYLLDVVKKKRIGIEVNPISNQVLHLVYDLRNHPASYYLSQGLAVTISSDDPGFWNAKGVNYDFYYAFMAIAPADAGLETLKKFAWTSLEQSVLTEREWMKVSDMFHEQWKAFIEDVSQDQSAAAAA